MRRKKIILLLIWAIVPITGFAQPSAGRIATPSEIDWELRERNVSFVSPTPPQSPSATRAVTISELDWKAKGVVVNRTPLFAIKTNLLYDAITALNIEAELPIGENYSVAAEWVFPWWLNLDKQHCLELLVGEVQGRYWFEAHDPQHPMLGWFAGVYFSGGYFDLEWNFKGTQGELWGGGLCGGYVHSIWRDLRLEYAVGLGLTHTKYRKYDAVRDCQDQLQLLRNKRGIYNWWGITKVEVSLVWMLNRVKRD